MGMWSRWLGAGLDAGAGCDFQGIQGEVRPGIDEAIQRRLARYSRPKSNKENDLSLFWIPPHQWGRNLTVADRMRIYALSAYVNSLQWGRNLTVADGSE